MRIAVRKQAQFISCFIVVFSCAIENPPLPKKSIQSGVASALIDTILLQAKSTAPRTLRLPRPVYSVGGMKDDANDEFIHTNGFLNAIPLNDGGVLVLDWAKLRLFDSGGRQVRVIGRKGQGPNEFLYLTAACQTRGDTLVVFDQNNFRISILTGKGELVRQFSAGGKMLHSYCFDDGTFIVKRSGPREASMPRAELIRMSSTGSTVARLGSFPEVQYLDGLHVPVSIVASGSTLYVGDSRAREILAYNLQGNLVRVFQLHEPFESLAAHGGNNIRRSIPVSTATARTELPKFMPTLRDMFADGQGNLWIQDYRPNYEPGYWTRYSLSSGKAQRIIYEAKMISGPEIIEIKGNRVLTRRRDGDGAAHFEITRWSSTP